MAKKSASPKLTDEEEANLTREALVVELRDINLDLIGTRVLRDGDTFSSPQQVQISWVGRPTIEITLVNIHGKWNHGVLELRGEINQRALSLLVRDYMDDRI